MTTSPLQKADAGAGQVRRDPAHGHGRVAATAKPAGQANTKVSPEDVLKSFNTWAFKREHPSDTELMQRVIAETIDRAEPLSFVLYWGKGPRDRVDAPDIACLDYLASLGERVASVYAPGAAFTLIFTDTHAKLNGYTSQATQGYFAAVEARALHRGFSSCRLSQLTDAALRDGQIETVTELPAHIRDILCESAAKWYRGEGSVEEGALRYYQGNMVEKRGVELAFPRSIFVTFNGSKLLSLFPSRLPIFYMYSLRRGFSIKPWFLSVDSTRDGAERELVA